MRPCLFKKLLSANFVVAPFESLVLMGALNFDHQQDSWKQVSGGTGRHTLQVLAHISTDSNAAGKLW